MFNQQFGSVYNPKFEYIGNHADDSNYRILKSVTFTTKEVENVLMQLDTNKARETDEIPNIFLRNYAPT